MSAPDNRGRRGPEFGAAMSFDEIAGALGATPQCVHVSYQRALEKLNAHPETTALWKLARRVAEERERRLDGRPGA